MMIFLFCFQIFAQKKKQISTPGEMETISLKAEQVEALRKAKEIKVGLEENK